MSDLDALRVIAASFYTVLLHLRLHHPIHTGVVSLFMPVLGLFDYTVAAEGCGWLPISILISLPLCLLSFVKFTLIWAAVLRLQTRRLTCPSNAAMPRLPPLPQAGVCEWITPLFCHSTFGGLRWLLRASQTYAMQLCSIMSDQHLHNLYPSYSLRTNHALVFFPAREAHE